MLRKILASAAAAVALLATAGNLPAQAAPAAAVPIVSSVGNLAAPPAPTAKDRVLVGFKAAKGDPTRRPQVASTARTALAGPYYNYALARQILTTGQTSSGLAGNLTIEHPYVEGGHSLAELAVASENQQNSVEAGWRKAINGVSTMFTFHNVNNVGLGYNTGFVEYAPTCSVAGAICPGDSMAGIAAGTSKRFQWQYSNGNWWLAYDGQWVGYFLGTDWSAASPPASFTEGKILSAYGETVHSTKVNTCTDMGNGLPSSDGLAARIGSLSIVAISPSTTVQDFGPTSVLPTTTPTSVYSSARLSATTMRYGGKGWSASGGTTGQVTNGC
jgi:hypothetical protein